MNKLLTFALLLSSSVYAQNTDQVRIQAGCGAGNVNFKVAVKKNQQRATPPPTAGKAIVYFLDEQNSDPLWGSPSYVLKVGADGTWVGATRGNSYMYFEVQPGEHRVCTSVQSSFPWLSKQGSAVTIAAEAGSAYYVRARFGREDQPYFVKLELIDGASGQFMLSNFGMSVSHRKSN